MQNGDGKSGALIVVEGNGTVAVGASDVDGGYTIFNLPPGGGYTVRGYGRQAAYQQYYIA